MFEDSTEKIKNKYDSYWEKVKKITKILKKEYKAETVKVFGSLLDINRFHLNSDIDLAVSGMPPENFFKAYGDITARFAEIEIDLVDIEDCKKSLLKIIEQEGIEIE